MLAIQPGMAIDPDAVEKPFRSLRKALKSVPKSPHPEEVHGLRTQTRRLEAVVHALMLDETQEGSRVLKALKPIRKTAGKVRDLDVLVGFASGLAEPPVEPLVKPSDECLIELLEQLADRRVKAAAELHTIIAAQRQKARRSLKQCARLARRQLEASAEPTGSHASAKAMAQSLQLAAELGAWPMLNAQNIHPFRIKAKELRYTLQLAEGSSADFVMALGQVKDSIGAWHDWSELASVASEILHHSKDCTVLKQIDSRAKDEFKKALTTANSMRRNYLNGSTSESGSRKPPQIQWHPAIVRAAAGLAG